MCFGCRLRILQVLTSVLVGINGGVIKQENNAKRIVGGIDAQKNEFPWQAAIRWNVGITKDALVCGGSLIHKSFVLTAAHCFVHGAVPFYYYVLLGDHDNSADGGREQKHMIKNIITHPHYNMKTHDNDIALVQLASPVTLNAFVNLISLPVFSDFERQGTICTVTGWGATQTNAHPTVLQKVNVPIVSLDTCNHVQSYGGRVTGNMFCAGYMNGTADACQGDSGGPLQCPSANGDRWLLNGITSWGNGCGSFHKYGVYVRVRHYVKWIRNLVGKRPPTPLIPPPPLF